MITTSEMNKLLARMSRNQQWNSKNSSISLFRMFGSCSKSNFRSQIEGLLVNISLKKTAVPSDLGNTCNEKRIGSLLIIFESNSI